MNPITAKRARQQKKKLSEIETEKKWMVNGNNIRGKMKRLRLK